ncbi:polysaccharide deacetylase family protein [Novipirellula sp. SH528]|uniref:polysaccharide deacetylase family protein n=1 Tax=Novipirellula sp. SH528 TaxID=3454466 RepID=UPI003F9F4BC6
MSVAISLTSFALVLFVASWCFSRSRRWQFCGSIFHRANLTERIVAITFDDGPTPLETDCVLQILRDAGVKATFFLVGRDIEKYPESARAISCEGHEIGNHSYSHSRLLFKSHKFLFQEIERTDVAIKAIGYSKDTHFRPPYCKKLIGLPVVLARLRKHTITWDIEPDSSRRNRDDPARIEEIVLSRIRPGSIVLLHVMGTRRKASLQALPRIINSLQQRGFLLVRVSELLEIAAGGRVA